MNATTTARPWAVILDPDFTIQETAYLMGALDCRLELIGDEPSTLVPTRPDQKRPDTIVLIELLTHPRAPAVRPLREALHMVSILAVATSVPEFGIAEVCGCCHGADLHLGGEHACAVKDCTCTAFRRIWR